MLTAGIKARNTKFKKLKALEKRVAIAKDVIKQLERGIFIARFGEYVFLKKKRRLAIFAIPNESLQEVIDDKSITCNVCAKGALFCSFVKFENEVTVLEADTIGSSGIKAKLKGIFTEKQLDLIEVAFEGRTVDYNNNLNVHEIEKAKNFYNREGGTAELPPEKIIRIMENIIKYKGTFKP